MRHDGRTPESRLPLPIDATYATRAPSEAYAL